MYKLCISQDKRGYLVGCGFILGPLSFSPLHPVRTTQQPMQIMIGLGALVLKGRTSDLGTWGKGKG